MNSNTDNTETNDLTIINFQIEGTENGVEVLLGTLKRFNTFKFMIEDLGEATAENFPKVPLMKDSYGVPIIFTIAELKLYFELFELITENAIFAKMNTLEKEMKNFELIKKYLILTNYLDNETFLNTLAKYTAQLIYNGKLTI